MDGGTTRPHPTGGAYHQAPTPTRKGPTLDCGNKMAGRRTPVLSVTPPQPPKKGKRGTTKPTKPTCLPRCPESCRGGRRKKKGADAHAENAQSERRASQPNEAGTTLSPPSPSPPTGKNMPAAGCARTIHGGKPRACPRAPPLPPARPHQPAHDTRRSFTFGAHVGQNASIQRVNHPLSARAQPTLSTTWPALFSAARPLALSRPCSPFRPHGHVLVPRHAHSENNDRPAPFWLSWAMQPQPKPSPRRTAPHPTTHRANKEPWHCPSRPCWPGWRPWPP